ncbi:MAG: transporter substrate-binding domain-containing protein, partial [Alphaproteobacteria bacterium]|nr:transporter substrate-binding domain-containing protein [Alphaproteobacteria bacterium]
VAAAEDAPPFRLCADPDNLPFSSKSASTPGFYIELGQAIAAKLGRPFVPVWEPTYIARRAVRTSLLEGRCDGFAGLPDEPDLLGPRLILSKPIVTIGYALMLPQGIAVKSLSDLASSRVAVQFASPPQSLLATRTDVETVTVLSPEEAVRDLTERRADTAFIWGPSAGWLAKTQFGGAYHVVPVAGPHMQWRAAIGFRSDDVALRDHVNAAISELGPATDALMMKYGFPREPALALATVEQPNPGVPVATPAETPRGATPSRQTAGAEAPQLGDADAGHTLFNENCSHCHGPNAVEGERRRNLRLLHHRYGDDLEQVFMTTVALGRMTKGMPSWSGILTLEQAQDILAFLRSVQEP